MRIYLAGCYSRIWILYAYLLGRRKWKVEDTFSLNRGGTETLERYINANVSGRDRSVGVPHSVDYRGGVLSLT